jgi:hypothetical protein
MDRKSDPHIECVESGAIKACIWRETPCWPEISTLIRPHKCAELAMLAVASSVELSCRHARLICSDVDIDNSWPRPGVTCADCGQKWSPAPLVDSDPADRELLASVVLGT